MIATPIILELIIDAPIELKPYVSGCIIGPQGDSAYQIAVDNGFVGTEQDWLDSLVGANGADGKDAYESYLDTTSDNPVLTEAQWSASFEIDWATNLDMSQGTSTTVVVNPLQFNYGFGYNSLNANFDDLDTNDKTIIGSINELNIHNNLANRDAIDAHPISSITDLQTTLNSKLSSITTDTTLSGKGTVTEPLKLSEPIKPKLVEFKGKTDWGNSGTSKTITEITTKMNFLTLTGNCVLTLPEFEYETECISFMIRVAQDSVGGRSLTINKSTGTAAINLSEFDFSTGTIGQYCWVTVLWDTEVLVFTSSKYI